MLPAGLAVLTTVAATPLAELVLVQARLTQLSADITTDGPPTFLTEATAVALTLLAECTLVLTGPTKLVAVASASAATTTAIIIVLSRDRDRGD
jgi:hypothetical protein